MLYNYCWLTTRGYKPATPSCTHVRDSTNKHSSRSTILHTPFTPRGVTSNQPIIYTRRHIYKSHTYTYKRTPLTCHPHTKKKPPTSPETQPSRMPTKSSNRKKKLPTKSSNHTCVREEQRANERTTWKGQIHEKPTVFPSSHKKSVHSSMNIVWRYDRSSVNPNTVMPALLFSR